MAKYPCLLMMPCSLQHVTYGRHLLSSHLHGRWLTKNCSRAPNTISSHPTALVVNTISERNRQLKLKYLDLLGCKSYSSAALQFSDALLVKYNSTNYIKFSYFIDHLPQEQMDQFQGLISEEETIAKASLQALLSVAGTAFHFVAAVIFMCRGSGLQTSGLPREV